MKRREGSILFVLIFLLSSLTACGSTAEGSVAEERAAENVTVEVKVAGVEQKEEEALAFVREMKTGWNLGNTLDAYADGTGDKNELLTETSWGNPKTTKEMILAVKEAGFRTVRIPVTWHNHIAWNPETGELIISEEWLSRVTEIVDYAYEEGMYVILNIHHDNAVEYFYPDQAHYVQSEKYITGIWSQLAEHFKDYDAHLIFESMNEPRLVGHSYEWWYNPDAAECQESAKCINKLNQAFVDTVRQSGGNNADRYLMVPGYCASLDGAVNEVFCLPEDTAENKLIVSVHAYTPYHFALQAQGENGAGDSFSQEEKSDTKEIDHLMNTLYEKYVSQGIPVVIGEYGARNKENNLQARVAFYEYYIEAARKNGITCCVWDNGVFTGNGELFGLLSRHMLIWRYPEIIDAIMKYAE